MALTVAVEEVIGEHYNDQLRIMNEEGYTQSEEDIKLKKHLKEFRDDELEHLDTGLQHNAEQVSPLSFSPLTFLNEGTNVSTLYICH
jgi:ubiquinone biosynthesis monooxygenase Coq7